MSIFSLLDVSAFPTNITKYETVSQADLDDIDDDEFFNDRTTQYGLFPIFIQIFLQKSTFPNNVLQKCWV